MKGSVQRSAPGNKHAVGVLAAFILASFSSGLLAQGGSRRSACRDSLEKGSDLLAQQKAGGAQRVLLQATQACPEMPEIYNTLGLAYDFGNEYENAQKAYHRAVALAPRNAAFRNNLAASYFRSGKQDGGVAELRRVLELDPDNRTANLNLGSFYLRTKQYRRAIRCFQAARVDQSQDPIALLQLMEAYFGVGQSAAARALAGRLSRLAGQDARLHFSLGLQLAKGAEYGMAAEQFESIPANERDAAADINLGMTYSKLRQFENADKAYHEAIRLDASNPDPYFHLGLDASDTGNHESALDWITQAHSKAPERADISYALAEELIRVKNFESARDLLSAALERQPDDAGFREALGDLCLAQGNPEQAVQAYLRCLRSDPRRMKARLALARTYAELRENQKAADELQEILSVDPANSEAKAQRGHLALEAGQQEAALKWTTQALSVDPNNLTAIENFAVLMERQGKPAEARIALQKLVSSNPRNPRFHYLLGRVLSKLHQPDEAKAEFELSKQLEAVPVAPSQ